jgi:hypothetical protein
MALIVYVALVILSGSGALWIAGMPNPVPELVPLLFWVLANMLGEVLWLPGPRGRGYLSMATAANFASVLILPTPLAIFVTAGAGALVDIIFRHRRWYKVLFNAGMCSIAVFASSRVLNELGGTRGSVEQLLSPLHIGAMGLSALTYLLLNTWLVSGAVALDQKCSAWRIWRETYACSYELFGSVMLFLLGLYFAALFLTCGYASAFIAAITMYFVRDAYSRYVATLRPCQEMGN